MRGYKYAKRRVCVTTRVGSVVYSAMKGGRVAVDAERELKRTVCTVRAEPLVRASPVQSAPRADDDRVRSCPLEQQTRMPPMRWAACAPVVWLIRRRAEAQRRWVCGEEYRARTGQIISSSLCALQRDGVSQGAPTGCVSASIVSRNLATQNRRTGFAKTSKGSCWPAARWLTSVSTHSSVSHAPLW